MFKKSFINIIWFLIILVISWVTVHLMAVLGIFLLFAYPIWILTNPNRNYCIFCSLSKNYTLCPLCRFITLKTHKIFPIILLNIISIILITATSIGIIFTEKALLTKTDLIAIQNNVTLDIPIEEKYKIGEIFLMPIHINDIKVAINTVQADIKYDSDMLEIIDILTNESFANIFIQKEINNNLGFSRLTGGLPNPGYFGDNMLFCKVLFRCKAPGVGEVEILPSSLVLANDGKGTNVLATFPKKTYVILPETITETENEYQETYLEQNILGISDSSMNFFKEENINIKELISTKIDSNIDLKQENTFFKYLYIIDKNILEILNIH